MSDKNYSKSALTLFIAGSYSFTLIMWGVNSSNIDNLDIEIKAYKSDIYLEVKEMNKSLAHLTQSIVSISKDTEYLKEKMDRLESTN